MSELLESRWQDTKTALLEGLDGNKKAVMGALTLYLDFINLFIMLLRLFGQRR